MTTRAALDNLDALLDTHTVEPHYTAGHVIGIIAVDLVYPKMPGNVVNASTYDYPVLFHKVSFEIEQLFAGDESIKHLVIDAARTLEAEGVRAIVGACGYFAHFQQEVAAAVSVPVFLSSLLQLPLIKTGLKPDQSVLVLAADGDSLTPDLLRHIGAEQVPVVIQNVGDMPSFAPIRWGKTTLDNKALTHDLAELTRKAVHDHPEIGAILLECSDLPPYAWAIQDATGLPVFDFQTLISMVHASVMQKPYYGCL